MFPKWPASNPSVLSSNPRVWYAEPMDATPTEGSAKQESLPAHPEYGVPPHADAEIETVAGRPFWMYINDKGEEIQIVRCPRLHC